MQKCLYLKIKRIIDVLFRRIVFEFLIKSKDALKNARQPVFDVVDRKDHVSGGLNVRGHVKYELTMGTKRV